MEQYNELIGKRKPLMLFRCTTQEFAERFIKSGNIRFGTPKEWIDCYKKSGNGRGDLLEGCFASVSDIKKREYEFYRTVRSNVTVIPDKVNKRYYFQSRDILGLRTFCLFSLNKELFSQWKEEEDRNYYPVGKISKKYFSDFSDELQKDYDNLSPDRKPVLLMIKNPKLFFDRLINKLCEIGFEEDEILIQHVKYVIKDVDYYINEQIPYELFFKDISFNYQNEIRVVLFPKRFMENSILEQQNGIIDLGCMKDIAEIQDYYFKDIHMQLRGNSIIYTLPKPVEKPLNDPMEIIGYIHQIYRDELPGPLLSIAKRDELVAEFTSFLKSKYGISFDKDNLTFFYENGEEIRLINIWETLFRHGYVYYERGEFEKSIDQYSKAIAIDSTRAAAWYNRAVSYFKLQDYQKMFDDMNKAIELEPTNSKYINERNKQLKRLGKSFE